MQKRIEDYVIKIYALFSSAEESTRLFGSHNPPFADNGPLSYKRALLNIDLCPLKLYQVG